MSMELNRRELFKTRTLCAAFSFSSPHESSHVEEDLFAYQIEMDEIRGNKNLVESLRKGSKNAKLRKGAFVDV